MLYSGDTGCRNRTECDSFKANEEIIQNKEHKKKCNNGDDNYCSTAIEHPGEVIAFTGGGLLLAGIGATAVSGATVAEGVMVGLNMALDCATTYLSGSQCSSKNALTTYAFSLITGGIRGRVADMFMPLESPEGMGGLIVANMVLSFGSNSLQRAAKGNPTMEDNMGADIISGGISAGVQMATGIQVADPALSGPVGQSISGIVSALLGPFNPDRGQIIFPAPQ